LWDLRERRAVATTNHLRGSVVAFSPRGDWIALAGVEGKAGVDYCVVTAQKPEEIDAAAMPFVNLNAMALMGVGILSGDAILFRGAYETFTGRDVPPTVLEDFVAKILWVIRALPRIVRCNTDDIHGQEKIRKLFAASA
jgi:hypothetical protein